MRLIMLRVRHIADGWSCAALHCGVPLKYRRSKSPYCSVRCRKTEQARRRRLRNLLRRTGIACVECGVAHYEDGTVGLPGH